MEAVILCGGLGTRLRSIVSDVPKSMATIGDKPFLQIILDKLIAYKFNRVVLCVGYKKEIIQNYFKNNYKGMDIIYSIEDELLGTGGALKKALSLTKEKNVFVINGDVAIDINFNELLQRHLSTNAKCTLSIKFMRDFDRYGHVIFENNRIIKFEEKKPTKEGYINIGCYVVNDQIFKNFNIKKFSFEKDFISLDLGKNIYSFYIYNGYFKDIGIPSDYNEYVEYKIKKRD